MAINEAGHLVSHLPFSLGFSRPSAPDKWDRPLFTPLAHAISQTNEIALVIAGTSLSLRDKDMIFSAIEKDKEETGEQIMHTIRYIEFFFFSDKANSKVLSSAVNR